MKRLQVLLLVALSSALLLTGCGKEKEEKLEVEATVVEQIIDDFRRRKKNRKRQKKSRNPTKIRPRKRAWCGAASPTSG